jgi:hypothetical protein
MENMSRSLSEIFAEWSELSKMRGDLKQLQPIFQDVNADDQIMVYNESRHPQFHADVFGFLISLFLTKLGAILLRFFLKKYTISPCLCHISAAVHQIIMTFCTAVEYDPHKLV